MTDITTTLVFAQRLDTLHTLMLVFFLAFTLGLVFTSIAKHWRQQMYLSFCAAQDFAWRTAYYRSCGHWRWQKDWVMNVIDNSIPPVHAD